MNDLAERLREVWRVDQMSPAMRAHAEGLIAQVVHSQSFLDYVERASSTPDTESQEGEKSH